MTKVGGSLGFTLRKADSSALGHYVRALVREPALSDGRIRPGDKIVAVDGAPLSPMSHEEAVQLLRQCGPTVRLRLYRDLAQTPVSALSPTEPDHPLRPPRTSLRYINLLTPFTTNLTNFFLRIFFFFSSIRFEEEIRKIFSIILIFGIFGIDKFLFVNF